MNTALRNLLSIALLTTGASFPAFGQSLPKARMFQQQGLNDDAKRELIAVAFSNGSQADKAKALDLLATIALDEGRVRVAVETWQSLITQYPKSDDAKAASERMPQISAALEKSADEFVADATARLKLQHGDFWSRGRDEIYRLDTSWLDHIDASVSWYDQVIAEYKGTPAARIAYEHKIRTLIGWREPGREGTRYGAQSDFDFARVEPKLIATFREFEAAFPDATSMQALRYQIAQVYWGKKDWKKTKEWLNEILKKDGTNHSFYFDLATRRLTKVEY